MRLCRPLVLVLLLVASLGWVSCAHGGGSVSDEAALRDSVARLRQEGKEMRNQSRYDDALRLHTRGLDLAKALRDTSEWVQALNNIATDYRRMGILDVAQEYHYTAYRMCEESARTDSVMRKNRVVSLNGLGNIYLSVGNYERADSAFRLALAGERALGSATGQAINYANLGAIYSAQGNDARALECYRQSMRLNQESGNTLGQALCHISYGSLHEKHGRYRDALADYEQAYRLMKGSPDKWHSLEATISLASVNYDLHREQQALALLQEAERVAQSIHSLDHLVTVNKLYYRIYEREGRFREALDHHVMATTLQDSVLDSKKRDRIHNMGISIDRGRQQQRIDLAQAELQVERRAKSRNTLVLLAIVAVLLLVIGVMYYVQRMRRNSHRLLQQTASMRENFFTNITHEFRTPLTVILGLSRDIEEHAAQGSDLRHKAHTIQRQGGHLLSLITQLLDISRVKSVVGEPDWRHGNLAAQVAMVIDTYQDYARERGIELRYVCGEELCMDFVPDYVNKVVGNLVSNSLKFTPQGGTVTVTLHGDGKWVRMDFADTGCGIEANVLPHIFQPFYTNSTHVSARGTGVGLALVSEIVATVGGRIAVESAPGQGTTFHIDVPVRHKGKPISTDEMAEVPGMDSMEADEEALPASMGEGHGLRQVLVVEDNRDVAGFIAEQLGGTYEIHFACDGQEGLEQARALVPDIIVSDVMMPRVDGLEFCRMVRSDELLSHIPVIMVTAKVTEEDRLRGLEAGADAYLAKPFNQDELRIRVDKLLEQRELLRRKYAQNMVEERPQQPVPAPVDRFMERAERLVLDMTDRGEEVTVASLSDGLGINTRQLHRKVTGLTGQSPNTFIRIVRIHKAQRLLTEDPSVPLKNVAYDCGFTEYSHFARVFKAVTGLTPTAFCERESARRGAG